MLFIIIVRRWYSSDSELPTKISEMDLYADQGLTYRFYVGTPTVAFGFGLSYTTFTYSNLRLNASTIGPCDALAMAHLNELREFSNELNPGQLHCLYL